MCGPTNLFNDAVVCVQPYALCISAPCTALPAAAGQPAMAECKCDVVTGASLGKAACADRAPGVGTDGRKTLVSTYSFQQTLPATALMTCPPTDASGKALRYADCYNFPCIVDKDDPAKATCTCPILPAGNATWITRGGQCDTSKCSELWSGAPSQANTQVNWQLACDIGLPHPPEPYACPNTAAR